jgi:hypothetical protein
MEVARCCDLSALNCNSGSCHIAKAQNAIFIAIKSVCAVCYYKATSGVPKGFGVNLPPEIPKFRHSWVEFLVPWNTHPQKPNLEYGFYWLANWVEPWLGATAPRSPFSLPYILNLICWTQRRKFPGVTIHPQERNFWVRYWSAPSDTACCTSFCCVRE